MCHSALCRPTFLPRQKSRTPRSGQLWVEELFCWFRLQSQRGLIVHWLFLPLESPDFCLQNNVHATKQKTLPSAWRWGCFARSPIRLAIFQFAACLPFWARRNEIKVPARSLLCFLVYCCSKLHAMEDRTLKLNPTASYKKSESRVVVFCKDRFLLGASFGAEAITKHLCVFDLYHTETIFVPCSCIRSDLLTGWKIWWCSCLCVL